MHFKVYFNFVALIGTKYLHWKWTNELVLPVVIYNWLYVISVRIILSSHNMQVSFRLNNSFETWNESLVINIKKMLEALVINSFREPFRQNSSQMFTQKTNFLFEWNIHKYENTHMCLLLMYINLYAYYAKNFFKTEQYLFGYIWFASKTCLFLEAV